MLCPKCGRVLEQGEICQCQIVGVAMKEQEIKAEKEAEAEANRAEYNKKIKEKSEKMEAVSKAANTAALSVTEFFKYMLDCFKNIETIEDVYIKKDNKKNAIILMAAHALLTVFCIYNVLANSAVSFMFVSNILSGTVGKANFWIASFCLGIIPMCSKIGMMSYKGKEKVLEEVSSEYIFTIPLTFIALIASAISGICGLIFAVPIFVFGSLWSWMALIRKGMNKTRANIAINLVSLFIAILSVVVMSLIF